MKRNKIIIALSALLFSVFSVSSLSNNNANVYSDESATIQKESVDNVKAAKPLMTYTGIAAGWNNSCYSNNNGYHQLILSFGTHGVDYLANDHTANTTNRATSSYDIGNKLTFNGAPVYKFNNRFSKTHVGYDHGYAYFYVQYPDEVLLPTKDYSVPTFHIEQGTEFMDVLLPEVTLKFVGGVWIVTDASDYRIEYPTYYNTYLTVPFPHQFGTEAHAVLAALPSSGIKLAFNINTGDLDLTQNNTLNFDGLYKCLLSIYPSTGTIQLVDRDASNSVVKQFSGYQFTPNTDYNFEIEIVCGYPTTFKFAINHFLLINHSFNRNKSVSADVWVVDTSGSFIMDFYQEIVGYKPIINIGGSSSYDFMEGDPVYNFVSIVTAFDIYNDAVNSSNLSFLYQDGAVTDGRYNAGTWTLTISLSVDGYKNVSKIITINVHGAISIARIYYDDSEPIEVLVGTKLTPPPTPATYRVSDYDYVFEGWYFEGAKWDFDNNIVQGDMHLYSRFIQTAPHYAVSVIYQGLNKSNETLYITSGSSLPFTIFEVSGATFDVYRNNVKINSLIVNSDVTITVKYTVVFTYMEPKDPTYEADGNYGYWYSEVYPGYYFADPNGRELLDEEDVIIPKLIPPTPQIDDEDLVINGDYKLFTINDYPFSVNDAYGYMFYASSDFVDAFNDSFGFRFIVNIPQGQAASTSAILKMACINIYGASPIIQVTLNYGSNSYLSFNGVIDWTTNLYPTWTEGVDHLVEVYMIKNSSTTCHVFLGIDGDLIWKSAQQSLAGLTFHNFFTTTGTNNTGSYYKSATDTTTKALNRFSTRQLHSNDVSFDDYSNTGACRGENGYYAKAKSYYNHFLTSNQKKAFATNSTYALSRQRMIAWAEANGETLSFNGNTGDLILSANRLNIINNTRFKEAPIIIVLVGVLGISCLLFFLIQKKKKTI